MELICCILILIAVVLTNNIAKKEGYKQGQIDYANGKIKYELKTKEDNQKMWEEKK